MTINYLGRNIQFLRKEKKLSQQALAECLNLTRSKVASYENGIAEPSATRLVEIARFFNVSINQLIEEDLKQLPNTQILAANTNIQETINHFLGDRKTAIMQFEKKSGNLRKITEGLKAFHELKKSSLKEISEPLQSLLVDFENLLKVMDNLIDSNDELIVFLNRVVEQEIKT